MSIDIEELKQLYPHCLFKHLYINLYRVKFISGFTDTFSISCINHKKFKYIYDTNEYVMNFLKANGFIKLVIKSGNMLYEKLNFIIYVQYLCYKINNHICYNADELIEMIKKELDIQTMYKPVIESTWVNDKNVVA